MIQMLHQELRNDDPNLELQDHSFGTLKSLLIVTFGFDILDQEVIISVFKFQDQSIFGIIMVTRGLENLMLH